ncbi:hypothetical protein MOQ_005673 [Trypanosoma cruzi marinkellei]|uniref:Uncharacterized protein n=1 Tax=Trypanosoma cruzi marinkellei TaxID=85056 RepID=K2MXJ1_TRYCR|nr:hypothetical protein MOQ_005673 [Trypanosoma cruzi marinkellei]
MVLAEESAPQLQATTTTNVHRGVRNGREKHGGESTALGGDAEVTLSIMAEMQHSGGTEHAARLDAWAEETALAPSNTQTTVGEEEINGRHPLAMSHWSPPDESPPAWTRPSFVESSSHPPSPHAGQVVRLQEVFPTIGGRRHRRIEEGRVKAGEGKEDWPFPERQEKGEVETSAWVSERRVPRENRHGTRRVVDVTHSGSSPTMGGGVGRRDKSPLMEVEKITHSWQEIMQNSGRKGSRETIEERRKGNQPGGSPRLQQPHLHPNQPGQREWDAIDTRQEETAVTAEVVMHMQKAADELAHRVLMAERELTERRTEYATLREDLICCLEAMELPLREKKSFLRELQSENQRLCRLLGL